MLSNHPLLIKLSDIRKAILIGKDDNSMTFLRWLDRLNKLAEMFLGIAFALMTIFIFFQVLVRFVFTNFGLNLSFPWTEELSRYLMIWAVFVGAAVAMRKDNMIQLEAFVNMLPALLGKIIKVISLVITAIFFGFLVVISYEQTVQGFEQTSPVMGIPMGLAFSSILFGSVLMVLNIVGLLIESQITKKDIRFMSTSEEEEFLDKHMD